MSTLLDTTIRETARAALVRALGALDGVRSVRFVGSYWETGATLTPGDVDVVVILDTLTRERFECCVGAVAALDGAVFGMPGEQVCINDTFGPQKLGAGERVVVHLMIYDVASHRAHVLASPFTCLDWERVDHGHGPSLRETFAVPAIAPPALLDARRGVTNYLEDLNAGTLSVRRYAWDGAGRPTTIVERVILDPRNRGEFAVHVVRHLLANLTKVLTGRNEALTDRALAAAWERWVPNSAHLCGEYLAMVATKRAGSAEYGRRAVEVAIEFATGFGGALEELIAGLTRVVWMRHALTVLNDGRFLGQRRDPSIADPDSVIVQKGPWSAVRASPARRAVETAALAAPGIAITHDPRLLEIDCGDAEGLSFADVGTRFPELVRAWRDGEDPPFPAGESHADVLARLDRAIADLQQARGDVLVVTHNVVLRVLLGSRLGVPRREWHRIAVGHLEPVETFVIGDRLVPHLPPERLGAILDLRVGA